MLAAAYHPLGGRFWLVLLLMVESFVSLSHAAAFPDWTDCPAVCQCKWTSGKKSALCPDAGLTSLPASLDPEMQVLDLSGNRIPELQDEIFKRANLLNLQKVFLRHAGIHNIHAQAFNEMKILVEIDLSDNNITRLNHNTFEGNDRLRVLILSGNPLGTIRSFQFPDLIHMRSLQLARCSLTHIHVRAFNRLKLLETLNLDDNLLEYLDVGVTRDLKNLKTLNLNNNKWRCDCRLKEFRAWIILNGPKLYRVSQYCHVPPKLEGRLWEDVKPIEFACKPEVNVSASSLQAEINGNLSLACSSIGDPEPEVWWHLNGNVMNGTRSETNLINPYVAYSSSVETHEGSKFVKRWINITIYNTSDADAGEYTCIASNVAGNATKAVTVAIPRVFTAPSLSQTDDWLLWVSLAGGGAVLCASVSAILMAFCFCGGTGQRKKREKIKLEGSSSFGDQENTEKTFLVTGNSNEPISQGSLADNCSPGDLELVERGSICDPVNAANVTVERLRQAEICSGSVGIGALPCTAIFPPPPPSGFGTGLLPAGTFGNIFISVSLPQDSERCYPDLLDIPVHGTVSSHMNEKTATTTHPALPSVQVSSFATLPRRSLRTSDLGSPYDNMGPRVTATGSSTFSLTDPDLRLSPIAQQRVIQPPPEFVSL